MQQLWSKILAGEANKPGTYSRRTINLLYSIDKLEAELFTNLCSYGFYIGGEFIVLFKIAKSGNSWNDNSFYTKNNLNFETLTHLTNIGLINFDGISCYDREYNKELLEGEGVLEVIDISCFNKFKVRLNDEKSNSITLSHVLLTKIGIELLQVCNSTIDNEFFEYILNQLVEEGHTVYCEIS
jgi:hypothetical protein